MPLPCPPAAQPLDRAGLMQRLRRLLPATDAGRSRSGQALPFGMPEIDAHLAAGGLDALHEAAAESYADFPSAIGFSVASIGRLARLRPGAVFLVLARGGLSDWGAMHHSGFARLGLDPARLILVEAGSHEDALWAIEEIVRARAALAVLGCLAEGLGLKESRRLQLAADGGEALLLVLRPHDAETPNAASTRWRIAAVPGGRDRFGLLDRWTWDLNLSRARNGRPGRWRVEFDHVAYRFGLARGLDRQALPDGATEGAPAARLRGN